MKTLLSFLVLSLICVLPYAVQAETMCAMVVTEFDKNCNPVDAVVGDVCLLKEQVKCLQNLNQELDKQFQICLDKGAELLEKTKKKKRRRKKGR